MYSYMCTGYVTVSSAAEHVEHGASGASYPDTRSLWTPLAARRATRSPFGFIGSRFTESLETMRPKLFRFSSVLWNLDFLGTIEHGQDLINYIGD